MPIDFLSEKHDRKRVTIDFEDDTLELVYRPSALSVERFEAEREALDKGMGGVFGAQAESLAELIVTWDVVDDQGKDVEPTIDFFRKIGVTNCNVIYKAVIDDAFPNLMGNSSKSSGSSRRKAG